MLLKPPITAKVALPSFGISPIPQRVPIGLSPAPRRGLSPASEKETPSSVTKIPSQPPPKAPQSVSELIQSLKDIANDVYQVEPEEAQTVAAAHSVVLDCDKLSSVIVAGLNVKPEEARLHASAAVAAGLTVRANISHESAVEMLKRTGFYTIPVSDGSGHDVSAALRKHFLRKLKSCVFDGSRTVLLSPSHAEVHAFPNARYHYFPSDVADQARAMKICPCAVRGCLLVQKARQEQRVSYGRLSELPTDGTDIVVAMFVEGNAHTNEIVSLFQRMPHVRVYSAINVAMGPLMGYPLQFKHNGSRHALVQDRYICEMPSGDAYVHSPASMKSIFTPLVGQVCVKRTTVVHFESEYLTELTAASGDAVLAWRPDMLADYILPNLLVGNTYIQVPKEPFDKAVARCAATEDISFHGVLNVLMTNSLTITLSGISLTSRLPLTTDSMYGLAVFILLYVRHVIKYVKQEVTYQERKNESFSEQSIAGYATSVGYNAGKALGRKIGLNSELFESKTLMDAFKSWFCVENEYRSIADISYAACDKVLGPRLGFQSIIQRMNAFFAGMGFQKCHKQLYDKSIYSPTLAAEFLVKVAKLSVRSAAQFTAEVAALFRAGFEHIILGMLYVMHVLEVPSTVDKWRHQDYLFISLFFSFGEPETEVLWIEWALKAISASDKVYDGLAATLSVILRCTEGHTLVPAFKALVSLVAPQQDWISGLYRRVRAEDIVRDFDSSMEILSAVGLTTPQIAQVVAEVVPAKISGLASAEEEPLTVDAHLRVNICPLTGPWEEMKALEDAVRQRCAVFFDPNPVFPPYDPKQGPYLAYPPVLNEEIFKALWFAPAAGKSKDYNYALEYALFERNLKSSGIPAAVDAVPTVYDRLNRDKSSHALALKYDILVSGLPMAGKSALVRPFLTNLDVVVVPTRKLRDEWIEAIKDMPSKPEIVTQHVGLTLRGKRYIVVDEVYTYPAVHVACFYAACDKLILLGDPSQIGALFGTMAGLTPFAPEYFTRHADILLPYSFCPQDVVHFLMWNNMNTCGYEGPIFALSPIEHSLFYTDAKTAPQHDYDLFMVGTQMGKGKYSLAGVPSDKLATAHEAQGSRANSAVVVLDTREANFLRTAPAHFRVCVSRSRVKTVFAVESTSVLRALSGLVFVNGNSQIAAMFNTASLLSLDLDDTLFAVDRPTVYKHEDTLPKALFTMDDVALYPLVAQTSKGASLTSVNPGLLVVLPPNGGKTTLARRYHGLDIDDLFTDSMREMRDREEWARLKQAIQDAVLALYDFPRLLFVHNYEQVRALYPRPEHVLFIAHSMVAEEKGREAARVQCNEAVAKHAKRFSQPLTVANEYADVENALMRYILQHSSLCNVAPILGTPTLALSDGMPCAVDSLDLGNGGAIKRIAQHILSQKMSAAVDMAKPESWVASHINAVNRMAVENKHKDPMTKSLMTYVKTRVRTLFKRKLTRTPQINFEKNSAQWLAILEATDDPERALYADFNSKAFAKGEMPKKTSDLLKVQGVIYKGPMAQLLFAAMVKQITEFVKINLRPGLIADVGYTEDELRLVMSRLYAACGKQNGVEFDLDKQDTSHNKWHVQAFSYIAELAGVDQIYINLFEETRSRESVECLDHALKLLNHYSLGSGAPWTLIANILMALTTLVVDYDLREDDIVIQKGDDGYLSRELTPNVKLLFPNVSWKWRTAELGSFCSKLYSVFVIRKMGRRMWKLFTAQPTQPGFKEKLAAHFGILREIRAVGHHTYGEMLDRAFDVPLGSGFQLVCEYEFTFNHKLKELPAAITWSMSCRATRVVVSAQQHCAWRAILAVGGPTLADKYLHLRRRDVTITELVSVCEREKVVLHIEKCKHNTARQSRVLQSLGQDFRGIIVWHDHAVAVVTRDLPPGVASTG